jgi:hypothetical protein
MARSLFDFRTPRPSVFLDRWVWIRLARAAKGERYEPLDREALEAVRVAASAGVAFPLTSTYYIESLTTTDPRQRTDLARIIASITSCSTIRRRHDLVSHQMLNAMHLHFGRPAFRPRVPEVLGVGVFWAFLGKQVPLVIHGPTGRVDPDSVPGLSVSLRQMAQWAEVQFLSGARDDELSALRQRGYQPEVTIDAGKDRLAWETGYVEMLADDDPISRVELRVRAQAREFVHEYLDLFNELIVDYALSADRAFGIDPTRPGSARQAIVAFADDIPTLRLATDLKYHLFRDATKQWQTNHLYDIDAVSLAMPYCHAVLADKEITDLLRRSHADEHTGTTILAGLAGLVETLPGLASKAAAIGGDPTGWDWAGHREDFCLDLPGLDREAS